MSAYVLTSTDTLPHTRALHTSRARTDGWDQRRTCPPSASPGCNTSTTGLPVSVCHVCVYRATTTAVQHSLLPSLPDTNTHCLFVRVSECSLSKTSFAISTQSRLSSLHVKPSASILSASIRCAHAFVRERDVQAWWRGTGGLWWWSVVV